MSVGGPYNDGCASDVNGCLATITVLAVIGALIALALHALGVI